MTKKNAVPQKPNILMIIVDQMRFPRFGYGEQHGFAEPLKKILGFREDPDTENEFRQFFPGLTALANNAVILNNHKTASAACVPSRTVLFTGQYGTKTGSVQTDGVFKDGTSRQFPWLKADQFPTIGHWMKEQGYSTHYFGKWHISGEGTENLEDYGFSDWELSAPDPHGTLPNNLGYYRDYQFQDIVCSFLRRQGLGVPFSVAHAQANVYNGKHPHTTPPKEPDESITPWFAVSSFTNPHDIGAYPGIPRTVSDAHIPGAQYTLAVPPVNSDAETPKNGTMTIKLNRLDFPQNNADVPPTWDENLENKPDCQFDYSYKMGLALSSKGGRLASEKKAEAYLKETGKPMGKDEQLNIAVEVALDASKTGLPFALTAKPKLASRAFMQYYGYLMHEVDQHINNVLKTLEESGQADNTIVLFCADHGEYGAAHHMMMEKWHSAYEELLHVPMLVRFPPSMHQVAGGQQQISELTSHIDLLPTILGLTGANSDTMKTLQAALQERFGQDDNGQATGVEVLTPVGIDLSPLILGNIKPLDDSQHKQYIQREGVLFISHDTITSPFAREEDEQGKTAPTQYEVYKKAVETLQKNEEKAYPLEVSKLSITPHSVCQPNHVHCVVSNDNWKFVRYFEPIEDPNNYETNNQYELYDLNTDPCEEHNLLVYNNTQLQAIESALSDDYLIKAKKMKALLSRLEKEMLWLETSTATNKVATTITTTPISSKTTPETNPA